MKRKLLGVLLCSSLLATALSCKEKPKVEYPFQDESMEIDGRVEDLLSRLTLEEKVSLMTMESEAIPRLGIHEYDWWNEVLHGVARAGKATVFPQTIGMAASFDVPLVNEVFSVVSDEARIKHRQFVEKGNRGRYTGLTVWTPNINIFRDPRWGRGQETYGEDPYLTSRMGVAVVKGLQGQDANGHDKLHACAKHFAVHSGPEWNRHNYNAENIPSRDLRETYLYAFEALVKEADVREVMCAYNRVEGEPCCGSSRLLTKILRDEWGYDGIVVTDCWALNDFFNPEPKGHGVESDEVHTATKAVISGTDLECGSVLHSLEEAVAQGLITEERINESLRRLLKARMQLGEFDSPESVEWNNLSDDLLCSEKHHNLARKIATESVVLLQNRNGILPLKENQRVALVGPNVEDSVTLWANYNGFPMHTSTVLEGVKGIVGEENLIYVKGCDYANNTMFESRIQNCYVNQGTQGIDAEYWNNVDMQGEAAAKEVYNNPLNFSATGGTVFAPGVNLKDFSAKYRTTYIADEACKIAIQIQALGKFKLTVDGKEIKTPLYLMQPTVVHTFTVKAGETHDIELDFISMRQGGSLRFDVGKETEIRPEDVVKSLEGYDTVVMAGGISPKLEGEEMPVLIPGFRGGDRDEIQLPAVQRNLLSDLHKAGKKVIFVNMSGSAMGLQPETESCDAILQAWYGGEAAGEAIADILFGRVNPSGRLPITFYTGVEQLPDFEDYTMKDRTYRYMTQKPLFPFGYGLSYSTFEYGEVTMPKRIGKGEILKVTIPIKNCGSVDGTEVVQLYLSRPSDVEGPKKSLRGFARVDIASGETRSVDIELTPRDLTWYNPESEKMEVLTGDYVLYYGTDSEHLKGVGFSIE
ncbi:MAG: glycoside hydrolase family 3 C-terminal domain-containing protein [Marinilabiliaceae bacterium]|nr:glycoside hydrolase family 3 C-terminal domain-containing protein [Marinilabiliaceae bacterium]